MSLPGDDSSRALLVEARSALLDALEALREHADAVIVIGAQAIYLQTGHAPVALAEATKDSDLALDPRTLQGAPHVEEAMRAAHFYPNPTSNQPGAWMNPAGVPVDLMVPEKFAGPGGRNTRGARIPPHDKRAARRARGLEATLVDNSPMLVGSLDPADSRAQTVKVAGVGSLLVAKLHKIAERIDAPNRLNDKDAHDIYRILIAVETEVLATSCDRLLGDAVSESVTQEALGYLLDLFSESPTAMGSAMAGRAEEGLGEPATVSLAASLLAGDLLSAVNGPRRRSDR